MIQWKLLNWQNEKPIWPTDTVIVVRNCPAISPTVHLPVSNLLGTRDTFHRNNTDWWCLPERTIPQEYVVPLETVRLAVPMRAACVDGADMCLGMLAAARRIQSPWKIKGWLGSNNVYTQDKTFLCYESSTNKSCFLATMIIQRWSAICSTAGQKPLPSIYRSMLSIFKARPVSFWDAGSNRPFWFL